MLALSYFFVVGGFPLKEVGAGELDMNCGLFDVGLKGALINREVPVHCAIINYYKNKTNCSSHKMIRRSIKDDSSGVKMIFLWNNIIEFEQNNELKCYWSFLNQAETTVSQDIQDPPPAICISPRPAQNSPARAL